MQQSDNSSASDGTIVLPRYAINMARRVMQLLSATDVLSVTFVRVGDAWYIAGPGGKLERL